jgi:hypothetical protein
LLEAIISSLPGVLTEIEAQNASNPNASAMTPWLNVLANLIKSAQADLVLPATSSAPVTIVPSASAS